MNSCKRLAQLAHLRAEADALRAGIHTATGRFTVETTDEGFAVFDVLTGDTAHFTNRVDANIEHAIKTFDHLNVQRECEAQS
jgi:nanoRNase/pAp phosphatase (c-di-AMP/oligoRNAs hydrolase)